MRNKENKPKNEATSVLMDQPLLQKVKDYAQKQTTSMAAIIRQALLEYFEKREGKDD